MLDKILPLQEVFMASPKSAADKFEFLKGVSSILAKAESDTNIILGFFILFEDENRWCYQWDGTGFVPGAFRFPNHTGFAIYVNDGRDPYFYHSLHNESVMAVPLSEGFAVFSCKKNSRDYTFLHFCESWGEARDWLNSYDQDPNYDYLIE